jgi:ABC-type lipoprotein export system ATPase subunit
MIRLSHVCVSFVDGRGLFNAVDDFTCDFPARGLFFVTGESGAGKSTLLNAIGGLQKITSGEISSPEGTAFSYVFQDEGLLFSLSLLDNLKLAEPDEAKIVDSLEYVGLRNKLREPVSLLSKGERARLSIARALLSRSSAILLDEPTGNLDSANAARVYGLLSSVSKEKLVVVVSHDGASAERYADAILRMKDGKLVGEEALRPLPQGGPAASGAQDPGIPWAIKWRYSSRKMFTSKARPFLSFVTLFLAGTLLLLSLNFAFYDGDATTRRAVEGSDPLFFTASREKDSGQVDSGKDFSDHLSSLGIEPTYEIVSNLAPSGAAAGEYVRLILADSIDISGAVYFPSDGGAVMSDCLDLAMGAKVGDDLGGYFSYFKDLGITIGQEAATGYGAARAHFPDTASGGATYSHLVSDSYLFIVVNTNTYLSMLEKVGLRSWDFAWGQETDQSYSAFFLLDSDALGTVTLSAGASPTAKNEILINEKLTNGDPSSFVGRELAVYPSTHDYYEMSKHFSALKISGVYSDDKPLDECFLASQAFFEELKGEVKYETPNIVLGKDGLMEYVNAGRPSEVAITPAAVADPLEAADGISSAMAGLRNAFLIVGGLLALLSLSLLTLYSLDAMRRNEKDVAILKSLGKGGFSIVSMFFLMSAILVTGAVLLSFAAGSLITWWVGLAIQANLYLSFNPISDSVWSYLILLAIAYAVPAAASLLSSKAVYETDVATVFKRNLV